MPEIKKILVIRLSSFGDIVLSFPFITELRKKYTNAEIGFLTKRKFAPLVKMHKDINNILVYEDESNSELKKLIGDNNFDIIFDIHKNIRSVLSTLFQKSNAVRYKKGTFKKLLLVACKINLIKVVVPVYQRYLNTLKEGVKYKYAPSDLIFNREPVLKDPYILIAPSSKHFTKTLPKEFFAEIIKNFSTEKFIVIGDSSETDKSICGYLESVSQNVINYSGRTDFGLLANLIYNSKIVICNDSGVLHLAEALNKKTIAFFGSTVKEFGFFPQLKSTVVFENKRLNCRPCTHIGKSKCPKKHFKCMQDLNTSEIINKINESIS